MQTMKNIEVIRAMAKILAIWEAGHISTSAAQKIFTSLLNEAESV